MSKYVLLFPPMVGEPGVPGFGDKVIVEEYKYEMLLSVGPEKKTTMLASVLKNAKSGDSVHLMLPDNVRRLGKIATTYAYNPSPPTKSNELRLELKSLLENYRSVLDYLAHDIAAICKPPPKPKNVFFPIAGPAENRKQFEGRLRKGFPGLERIAPELFRYLVSIQEFEGTSWLRLLGATVNQMKHRGLVGWETVTCRSLIIHNKGVGLRFGEAGLLSMEIADKKAIAIKAPDGKIQKIRGPQFIDVNTTELISADPDIQLDPLTWQTFGLAGTSRSLVGFIAEIDRESRVLCSHLTTLLSKPQVNER